MQHEITSCCSVRDEECEREALGERGNVIVTACVPEYLSRLIRLFMPRSRHYLCTWKPPANLAAYNPYYYRLFPPFPGPSLGPSLGEKRLFSGLSEMPYRRP